MRKFIGIAALVGLLLPAVAFGYGGTGSTCDPSTPNWAVCARTPVPWASAVTNTVNVAGGTWTTPYSANAANTRYVLQGNVSANSTGINVGASNVIIDLNGYTLTYNQTSQGEGVKLNANNTHHHAIINGSIIQGAANSGGSAGAGSNPVTNVGLSGSEITILSHFFMANVYTKRTGYDVGGVLVPGVTGVGTMIIDSTQEDGYLIGTLANRHTNLCAAFKVAAKDSGAEYIRVTVKKARHRGIEPADNATDSGTPTIIRDSRIELNSLDTNAGGIFSWNGDNIRAYDNEIILAGNHPIGITFMGQDVTNESMWAYGNWIHGQRTASCGDTSGDTATGIRFGSYFDSTDRYLSTRMFNNLIEIHTDDAYPGINCATGANITVQAKGKGFFFGPKSVSRAVIANNIVRITGDSPYADGMSPMVNTEDAMFIIGNRIESTGTNVVLADYYAQFAGYPLFLNNTFVKTGTRSDYRTIKSYDWWGYQGTNQTRFVGNTYEGGASADNYEYDTTGTATVSTYFGHLQGTTPVYDYQLNKVGSAIVRTNYGTPITLANENPTTCPDWSQLCTTSTDCSTYWPGYSWTDGVCVPPSGGTTQQTCYKDADGDTYSDGQSEIAETCSSGYYTAGHFTALSGDCNDNPSGGAAIHPGASDATCNGIDEDCTGAEEPCLVGVKSRLLPGFARRLSGGAKCQ